MIQIRFSVFNMVIIPYVEYKNEKFYIQNVSNEIIEKIKSDLDRGLITAYRNKATDSTTYVYYDITKYYSFGIQNTTEITLNREFSKWEKFHISKNDTIQTILNGNYGIHNWNALSTDTIITRYEKELNNLNDNVYKGNLDIDFIKLVFLQWVENNKTTFSKFYNEIIGVYKAFTNDFNTQNFVSFTSILGSNSQVINDKEPTQDDLLKLETHFPTTLGASDTTNNKLDLSIFKNNNSWNNAIIDFINGTNDTDYIDIQVSE